PRPPGGGRGRLPGGLVQQALRAPEAGAGPVRAAAAGGGHAAEVTARPGPADSGRRKPLALLLTVALFAFWLALGYAVLAGWRRAPAPPLLLRPPGGALAAPLRPVSLRRRRGARPGARFAGPLAAPRAAGPAVVLARLRPPAGLRGYAPFAAVFLLGL